MKATAGTTRPKSAPRTGALYVNPLTVDDVVKKILKRLPTDKMGNILPFKMRPFNFGFKAVDVKGERRPLRVYVVLGDKAEPGAKVLRTVTGEFGGVYIVIEIPRVRTLNPEWAFDAIASTFTHELVHAKDWHSWTEKGQQSGTKGLSDEKYYNNPKEVSAYLSEVVRQLSTDIAVTHVVEFKNPLDWAAVYFAEWDRMEEYLYPKNRRRFLLAIYHMYDIAKRKHRIGAADLHSNVEGSMTKNIDQVIAALTEARSAIVAATESPSIRRQIAKSLAGMAVGARDPEAKAALQEASATASKLDTSDAAAVSKARSSLSTYEKLEGKKLSAEDSLVNLLRRLAGDERPVTEVVPIKAAHYDELTDDDGVVYKVLDVYPDPKGKKDRDLVLLKNEFAPSGQQYHWGFWVDGMKVKHLSPPRPTEAMALKGLLAVTGDGAHYTHDGGKLVRAGQDDVELGIGSLVDEVKSDMPEGVEPIEGSDEWAADATPEQILRYTLGIGPDSDEDDCFKEHGLRPKPTERQGMDILSGRKKVK